MSMWRATAMPLGVHPSALTAGILTLLPRNWIQVEHSLGIRFLAPGRLTLAPAWHWMSAGMFMWGATAQRLGVHPPAASPGALTLLPRSWIQAERSLGIRFLAARRVTFASEWQWMPVGMSVWRASAMPLGVHPSALSAGANMMPLSQRSPFQVQHRVPHPHPLPLPLQLQHQLRRRRRLL